MNNYLLKMHVIKIYVSHHGLKQPYQLTYNLPLGLKEYAQLLV